MKKRVRAVSSQAAWIKAGWRVFFVACFGVSGILQTAQATPLIFFGRDLNDDDLTTPSDDPPRIEIPNARAAQSDFFSHLAGVNTEDFESFLPQSRPTTLTFGADTATLTYGPRIFNVPVGTANGAYPISGDQFLLHFGTGGSFRLAFSTPQAAFGFFATDIGDGGASLVLTLSGDQDQVITVQEGLVGSGTALYFGVIDTEHPFTQVIFNNNLPSADGFGFDDMTIGRTTKVVPEPNSLALFGAGLLGVFGLSRRGQDRRRQER